MKERCEDDAFLITGAVFEMRVFAEDNECIDGAADYVICDCGIVVGGDVGEGFGD